jgi:hypothetical protein
VCTWLKGWEGLRLAHSQNIALQSWCDELTECNGYTTDNKNTLGH